MNFLEKFEQGFSCPDLRTIHVFHGSKSGLIGEISPDFGKANAASDFGKGFYLGDNAEQVLSYMCNHASAEFYEFELDLSGLNHVRLDGLAWMLTIAMNRMPDAFRFDSPIGEAILERIAEADVMSGLIADDKIGFALEDFLGNVLTDAGLHAALSELSWRNQYVLKTEKACEALTMTMSCVIDKHVRKEFIAKSVGNRNRSMEILALARGKYARTGLFVNELMEGLENDIRAKGALEPTL